MAMIRFVLQPNKMVVFNDTVARWVIPSSANYAKKTNLICDRANEDHCGVCGNGLLTNNPDINYEIIKGSSTRSLLDKVFTDEERYYFPFTL